MTNTIYIWGLGSGSAGGLRKKSGPYKGPYFLTDSDSNPFIADDSTLLEVYNTILADEHGKPLVDEEGNMFLVCAGEQGRKDKVFHSMPKYHEQYIKPYIPPAPPEPAPPIVYEVLMCDENVVLCDNNGNYLVV